MTLGIDLSGSCKKASPYALLDGDATLRCLASFKAHDELLPAVEEHRPDLIAIDAPLFLPLGLDCLEEDCACASANGRKGRVAEQELAGKGIGCFFTTKQSIIRNLIYRAMELGGDLARRGYPVIEVYPYATKVLLFGDEVPAKANPTSLPFLKEKLAGLIGGLDPHVNDLNHDRCDALLTAYTGYLHLMDRTDNVGLGKEGFISVPKLPPQRLALRRRKPLPSTG